MLVITLGIIGIIVDAIKILALVFKRMINNLTKKKLNDRINSG
jgi:hypothetical protein